jgi:membrane-associated protease RseP (regulator of RpoE activity)
MTTALSKAAPLALLLLLPAAAPAGAGDSPRKARDKEVVVDADPIVTLDDEDGPVVVGSEDNDEGDGPLIVSSHWQSRRGFLGVQLIDITGDLRAHFGAPRDAGVLVSEVEKDSPAAKAGISVGDVITRIDGDRMESAGDVTRAIRHKKKGDEARIEVERGKAARTLTATLEERRGQELDLGDLGNLTGRIRGQIHIPRDFEVRIPDLERWHGIDGLNHLQEKLDELDKRLRDLEKKIH